MKKSLLDSVTQPELFMHPATGKLYSINAKYESLQFKVGNQGMPHGGIHLKSQKAYTMADGFLIAARVHGDYPFLLIEHELPFPGSKSHRFYTIYAQFKPHSSLTQQELDRLKTVPGVHFMGSLKLDPTTKSLPKDGMNLYDENDKVIHVIPKLYPFIDLTQEKDSPPPKKTNSRFIEYNGIKGTVCLTPRQMRTHGQKKCILLTHDTVIPKTQDVPQYIPLYKKCDNSAKYIVEYQPPFSLGKMKRINENWLMVVELNGATYSQAVYIQRQNVAIEVESIPQSKDIWVGRKWIPTASLVAYGNNIHVEVITTSLIENVKKPLFCRILFDESAWKNFTEISEDHILRGYNEWAGYTKSIENHTKDELKKIVEDEATKACWWTPQLQQDLSLPSENDLIHIHPLEWARHWNTFLSKLPFNNRNIPYCFYDWIYIGALLALVKEEQKRLNLHEKGLEKLPLFEAQLARVYSWALDWHTINDPLELLEFCYPDVDPLPPSQWLDPLETTDQELSYYVKTYQQSPAILRRRPALYHLGDTAQLMNQKWHIQGLYRLNDNEFAHETIANLTFYPIYPLYKGFVLTPLPILKCNQTVLSPHQKAKIELKGFEPSIPIPSPKPKQETDQEKEKEKNKDTGKDKGKDKDKDKKENKEDNEDDEEEEEEKKESLEWRIWEGSRLVNQIQKSKEIEVTAPSWAFPPYLGVACYHWGEQSFGYTHITIALDHLEPQETPKPFPPEALQNRTTQIQTLQQLGYWAPNPTELPDAIRTFQYENQLGVNGTMDTPTIEKMILFMNQKAPLQTLRGRKGISTTINQKKYQFYQLPYPLHHEYSVYGEVKASISKKHPLNYLYANEKWGQFDMVCALEKILRVWHAETGDSIWVNDLSLFLGGKFSPHTSHQLGLDVDLRSNILGAREIQGYFNKRYNASLTADWIAMAIEAGFTKICTFDDHLAKKFSHHKKGKVSVVAGHSHHLHMSFEPTASA